MNLNDIEQNLNEQNNSSLRSNIGKLRDQFKKGYDIGSKVGAGKMGLLDVLFPSTELQDPTSPVTAPVINDLGEIIKNMTPYQRKRLLVILKRMVEEDSKNKNRTSSTNGASSNSTSTFSNPVVTVEGWSNFLNIKL